VGTRKATRGPWGSRRDGGRGDGVVEAQQAGADAVIGVDVDYESIQLGQGGSMLMVSASGTIVKL
jgi:basic membrane lipoprotein Med (substrate-binding protein (PBP1-ABC) superfamily)